MRRHTYKIYFLKENTQTEHSFLVDASNQKNAKQAFADYGEKLSSIIRIEKSPSVLAVQKVQSS